MTVFLTGGAGYIGSHTAVELLDAGYEVVIADDYSNSSPQVIDRIADITGKKPDTHELDITDTGRLEKLFSSKKIDAVIHFAGFKAVGESVRKPIEYYKNNLGCTLSLLEVMARHGVKKIIFSSSATVYGSPEQVRFTESMKTGDCSSPYGSTKQMSERIIMDAAAADERISAVLLRYFNPAGAHPSGLIGELPAGVPNNLMPFITQVAAGRLAELNVFGSDYPTRDGTCIRDYIHVVDLAKGHVKALEYCNGKTGTEVFNLGTGSGYSVLDIIAAFENATGVKIPYKLAPRRAGDIAEYFADASKAEKLMRWKAEKTIEDMCRDAWNWQKNACRLSL